MTRNVREAVGSAMQSSDLTVYETECDADRIGALAFSRTLAAELVRAKYGGGANIKRVHLLLVRELGMRADRMRWRSKRDYPRLLDGLAARALFEWINDRCSPCHGRGWVPKGEPYDQVVVPRTAARAACKACAGTGLARYSVGERALSVGLPADVFERHWMGRLDVVIATLQSIDSRASGVLTSQLERASIRTTR